MRVSDFVDLLGLLLTPNDLRHLPFVRTPDRWRVISQTAISLPIYIVRLEAPPQADMFCEFRFRASAPRGISCEHVTVCRDTLAINKGWLALLTGDIPLGLTEPVIAPPGVSRQLGPSYAWDVYAPPSADLLTFSREAVEDRIRQSSGISWRGLQRVLEEIGPPAVTFDLLACRAYVLSETKKAREDAQELINDMGRHRRWQTKADCEFALGLAERNEPMVELVGSERLRRSHKKLIERLRVAVGEETPGLEVRV